MRTICLDGASDCEIFGLKAQSNFRFHDEPFYVILLASGLIGYAVKSKFYSFIIALLVICSDFITKGMIVSAILPSVYFSNHYPYGGIGIFRNFLGIEFSIVHATNKGAAWSMLSEYQLLLIGVRIGLILLVLGYFLFGKNRQTITLSLGLVIGGAIANVIDFFRFGHVVDMFHFNLWGYDFPVFNVADSAIFIGIFCILIDALRTNYLSTRKIW